MSVNSEKINFASILGVESRAAPIVFAAAYVPLFAWFVRQSTGRRLNYVFVALAIFCSSKATIVLSLYSEVDLSILVRIAAFIIRAILAGSRSAGENLKLYITDVVLFSVGFFALLYSAYTLVLDRWLLLDAQPAHGVVRLAHNRRIFRVVVLAAVTLGVVGTSKASGSDPQEGQVYRTASTIIFLVLTVVLAGQTVRLALAEGMQSSMLTASGN
ncbi:hypothetical protein C0993_012626 [Termitomyces sp. T159_Od127]|nr:hypothetical protein C0993_012626 [Termitomyces sp. T159_Od127]